MIALLFYFLSGFLMHVTEGRYRAAQVVCWFGSFMLVAAIFWIRGAVGWGKIAGRLPRVLLSFGIVGSVLLLCAQSKVGTEQAGRHGLFLPILLLGVFGAASVILCRELWPRSIQSRLGLAACAAVGLGLVVARVVAIFITPEPFIDVFHYASMGCDALRHGQNPYSISYPDIYGGKFAFVPACPYPPGYFLCALPFRVLLGDVRYAHIVADLVASVALLLIARRRGLGPHTSALLATAWLAAPLSLFITEQSFIDPVISAWAGLFLLCLVDRKFWFAGVALGVLCTIKQYAFVVGVGAVPWLILQLPRQAVIKVVGTAAAVGAAIVLPFAIDDWPNFYRGMVSAHAAVGLRPDSFTGSAFVAAEFHRQIPGAISAIVSLATLIGGAVLLFFRRGGDLADIAGFVVVSYGFSFFFAPQAFGNYYQLLSYFLLLAVALLGSRRELPAALAGNSGKDGQFTG